MLRKALWDLRWTAFWFALAGAGYTLMVSLFFPVVREQSAQFKQLLASYPKGFLAAVGYTDITTFTGYLGTESLNLFWPIIVAVFATLAGASLVAKEVEDGTSEIWLSIPAPRWRLLLAKMTALAVALLAVADSPQEAADQLEIYMQAYYGVPAAVMSRAQACHAGTVESASEWFAAYRSAGARHLVVRLARPGLTDYNDTARALLAAARGKVASR